MATMTKQGTITPSSSKWLACECGDEVEVSTTTARVTCPNCVNKMAAPPEVPAYIERERNGPTLNKDGTPRAKRGEGKKYVPSGFPRGWHKKAEYVHVDGSKWCRGKKVG